MPQEQWLLTSQIVASLDPTESCASCAELRFELGCVKNQLNEVSHKLAIAEDLLKSLHRKQSTASNEEEKREDEERREDKSQEGQSLEGQEEPSIADREEERRDEKMEEGQSLEGQEKPRIADREEERRDEKIEEGHSLEGQEEPRIVDKEEERREEKMGEGHSMDGQEEPKFEGIIVTPMSYDNKIIILEPKVDEGDIQFSGEIPSLIKRVEKEPRKPKASKFRGDYLQAVPKNLRRKWALQSQSLTN